MNQHNILIIEDDTGIQALTQFSLEMDGYWQVTSAYVGKEGLFKAMNINPDVILLDLMMPDMGGIEILEKLRSDKTTRNIPVILFTAKLMETESLELENKNVIGLITKPFDCLTLSADILDMLKKYQLVAR
ncbi:MAG: response regulator [Pleurocapsa minor HA4230-MV1]|jgi:CheY-like chemotaxis protein|nr:response regulator [Pleurocapsa minor HA4230-MV1]